MLLAHGRRGEELAPLRVALDQEFEVATTGDGLAAADLAARLQPRLVVVATDLAGLPGLTVLRRLPRRARGGRPTVVAAVGPAGDPRLGVAVTHGLVDAALPLPQAPGRLVAAVWRLLDAGDEPRLARLAPGPRRLIERTRASFAQVVAAVAAGEALPLAELESAARELAAAARAGSMLPALDALRGHHAHTYSHSLKVAANLVRFGLATGMRAADVELLAQAGLAHDLGKGAVPPEVLDKPGALDEAEWRLVRRHPEVGAEALRASPGVADEVVRAAARHHERLDGSGYPSGLRGARLDEVALLTAIADVHAALTEPRAYKRALADAEALDIMRAQVVSHFEPGLFGRYEAALQETAAQV